jgi:hypothetical protein
MTEADLLSTKDWDSSQIEIWGLRLGISRTAASLAVRKHNLRLVQSGVQLEARPCVDADVCRVWTSGSPNLYVGPILRFSKSGEVVEMIVERMPDYALPLDRQVAVTSRFKGQTFAFFNGPYSNDLRLKLFGPETALEMVGGRFDDKIKDTNYIYPQRGVTINVSPRNSVDPTLDLIEVSFYFPKSSSHR